MVNVLPDFSQARAGNVGNEHLLPPISSFYYSFIDGIVYENTDIKVSSLSGLCRDSYGQSMGSKSL